MKSYLNPMKRDRKFSVKMVLMGRYYKFRYRNTIWMMEDKSVKNEYNISHRTIFHKYTNCKEDEMKKLLK